MNDTTTMSIDRQAVDVGADGEPVPTGSPPVPLFDDRRDVRRRFMTGFAGFLGARQPQRTADRRERPRT